MQRLFKLTTLVVIIFTTLFTANTSPTRAANSACYTGAGLSQLFFTIPMTLMSGDVVTASITSKTPGDEVNIVLLGPSYFNYLPHVSSPLTYTFAPVTVKSSAYRVDFWDYAARPTANKVFYYRVSINGGCDSNGPLYHDGRLNDRDGDESVAIYCEDDGSVKVLAIYKDVGYPAFVATRAEIAKVPKQPAENTVIKSGNGATLYRLTSGELQVNRPDINGNMYAFRFTDCDAHQQ